MCTSRFLDVGGGDGSHGSGDGNVERIDAQD